MRIAVDIGGTFTDLSLYDPRSGGFRFTKVPSTPEAFDDGVIDAVVRAGAEGARSLVHGSTIVINSLTQRRGARVALVTTAGFRDVIEIQRTNRPDLYNLRYRKPAAFVSRRHRYELAERVGPDGEVICPVDERDARTLGETLRREGFEAVAIAFLNSYRNPANEERCAAVLRGLLPDAFIALSSSVPQWREYERTNTAVFSAYVGPTVARYIDRLDARLDGLEIGPARSLMLSSGGRTTFAAARSWPIDLIESGPAAGVVGGTVLAARMGIGDFVTLDVGGTTAKACLVEAGEPLLQREYHFERTRATAGYPLLLTSLDLMEIGAGGGSIVQRDAGGALRVGPESAGAKPGPAAYGQGGTRPTVTDACLLTGRLPSVLCEGFALSPRLARQAFAPLAAELGLAVEDAAEGALRLAEATMARVLELSTVARGRDPRGLTLIAFGGQGPIHAASLAQDLGFAKVVIPRDPGVFSARGMIEAPWRLDLSATLWTPWPEGEGAVRDALGHLRGRVDDWLAREGVDGRPIVSARISCRYRGQTHSLDIALARAEELADAFRRAHERLYSFALDVPIEVTAVHLTCLVPTSLEQQPETASAGAAVPAGERTLHATGRRWPLPVYRRAALAAGARFDGPLVVEEETATTFAPPGSRIEVDEALNLIVFPGGA